MKFLVSLGLFKLIHRLDEDAELSWSDDHVPLACVESEKVSNSNKEQMFELLHDSLRAWVLESIPSAFHKFGNDENGQSSLTAAQYKQAVDLKPLPEMIEPFMKASEEENEGFSTELAESLFAAGAVSSTGKSEPTQFNFLAGQQRAMRFISEYLETIFNDKDPKKLWENVLFEDWKLVKCDSFRWQSNGYRFHALSANAPAKDKSTSNALAEMLAFIGVSFFPSWARWQGDRLSTSTVAFSRQYSQLVFSWPCWFNSLNFDAIKSLLREEKLRTLEKAELGLLGVSHVYKVATVRPDPKGYTSFGPVSEYVPGELNTATFQSRKDKDKVEYFSNSLKG